MASMATPDSGESNLLNEPGSVRQETTMARAGTLRNFLYQKEIVPRESVDLTGDVHVAVQRRKKSTRRTNHKAFPL